MTDALRIYVIATSGLVGLIGTPVLWQHWPGWKTENKFAWMAVVLINFAVFVGTIEVYRAGTPGGLRNYLLAVAETWLLIAVCYNPARAIRERRSRHKEKP